MRENLSSARPSLASLLELLLVLSDMLITHEVVDLAVGVLTGETNRTFECTTIQMHGSFPMDILEVQTVTAELSHLSDHLPLLSCHLSKERTSCREDGEMIFVQILVDTVFLQSAADSALLIAGAGVILEERGDMTLMDFLLLSTSSGINIRVKLLSLLTEINDVSVDGPNLLLRVAGKLHKVLVDT